MFVDLFLNRFAECASKDAIVWRDQSFKYRWLRTAVKDWIERLHAAHIASGQIVALEGDFSPTSIALFFALVEIGAVLVPLSKAVGSKRQEFLDVSESEIIVGVSQKESVSIQRTGRTAAHDLYRV